MQKSPHSSLPSSQVFYKQLQALTRSKKLLIAYSGGLDSHVLLHLASQLSQENNYSHKSQTAQVNQATSYQVRAMHIHHGLQEEADAWVPHCQQVCDELNIPIKIKHLNLTIEKGTSIEDVARTSRYAAFSEELQSDEVLLTAHHQNDQAETLLLQLFRGAGVQGLASMPCIANFGSGQHARPLLSYSRQSLETYAKENQLNFILDPSNQDSAFDRNYLRNEILPELRERWPSIDKTISRSARIQAETKQILNELAEQDLLLIQNNSNKKLCKNNILDISALKTLSFSRQKLVLRYWIDVNDFQAPSEKKLKHIFSDVIDSKQDAQPIVEWQGVEIRRFKNSIYLMSPLQGHDNKKVLEWKNPQKPFVIPSLNLVLQALKNSDYDKSQAVTVRFRQGGEKFYDSKRGLSTSLKNLFNESAVPPWLRSRIPLIYSGDTLVKIVGIE
jgi:tRNA(Ile)-lysidine synthase